jgi:lysophospholipase L1-like esterase
MTLRTWTSRIPAAVFGAAFAVLSSGTAPAADTPACKVPLEVSKLDRPLARTTKRLIGHEPLTIVAIGSSSTAGAGATSPNLSYPARLAVELTALFPGEQVTVINRGINGQDAGDMITRLKSDVIVEKPDLVIWQLGTNAALRGIPFAEVQAQIETGIALLKEAGADVLLVDPQFAPKVLDKPEGEEIVKLIERSAKSLNIGVFRRFAVMKHWHQSGNMAFDKFITPDGLHMNDWGYGCWAKVLGAAIAEAATRPTASAHASPTAP